MSREIELADLHSAMGDPLHDGEMEGLLGEGAGDKLSN